MLAEYVLITSHLTMMLIAECFSGVKQCQDNSTHLTDENNNITNNNTDPDNDELTTLSDRRPEIPGYIRVLGS